LLVDTGASMSAVDRDVARRLKLESPGAVEWRAINQAHADITPLRSAAVQIADDPRHWELQLIEIPNVQDRIAGYRLIAILGLDFLDRCKLTLDGPARTFTLELPR
jgi:predicted aspartyl protease